MSNILQVASSDPVANAYPFGKNWKYNIIMMVMMVVMVMMVMMVMVVMVMMVMVVMATRWIELKTN